MSRHGHKDIQRMKRIAAKELFAKPLLLAAKTADWQQVVGNGGPPCFHLEAGRFCLRAERWDGHKEIGGSPAIHEFISLEDLLRSTQP